MGVILFLTVGTTAVRDELGAGRDDHASLQRDLGSFVQQASKQRAACLAELVKRQRGDLFGKVLMAHEDVWIRAREVQDVLESRTRTSAEMASTLVLATDAGSGLNGRFKPDQDRIVLLSSDTAIGSFCAHVNAELVHRHFMDPRCGCGTSFGSFPAHSGCEAVVVRIVPELDVRPSGHEEYSRILSGLRGICDECTPGFERVLFNITGGFKGTVPAITWIAANVYKNRATLFYQHEDIPAGSWIRFKEDPGSMPEETPVVLEVAPDVW